MPYLILRLLCDAYEISLCQVDADSLWLALSDLSALIEFFAKKRKLGYFILIPSLLIIGLGLAGILSLVIYMNAPR